MFLSLFSIWIQYTVYDTLLVFPFLCFHNLFGLPHLGRVKSVATTPSIKETRSATASLLWTKSDATALYIFANHGAKLPTLYATMSRRSARYVFKPLFDFWNFAYKL